MTTTAPARRTDSHTRPWLGFRRRPGRLALLVFRVPLPLYRFGFGWVLGHTFLELTHVGRRTGKPHEAVAMVLAHDKTSGEAVICAVWGPRTDWVRNLRVHKALRVQIGREAFVPRHRFLTEEEAIAVGADFRRRHPWRLRLIGRVLGLDDLRSDAAIREFVRNRPFVALCPERPSEPDPRTRLELPDHPSGRSRTGASGSPPSSR